MTQKSLIITPEKLAAFEGRKKHSQVLNDLLKEIKPINIRKYLELPDEVETKQKHIVVAVIKHLLEVSRNMKWNLSRVFDYTYVYNGAFWQQLDKEDMKAFLGKAAIQMGCPDYEARHFEFKDKLLKQFLTDAHLPSPPVEPDKILINLQNGTMEFTHNGWQIRDFMPEDFLTYQLPFPYDPEATCPIFDKYLLEVLTDEHSRNVLQEYSGYIFTKMNLEKMLMLTGSGSNGKSVFFNIISALIGKENLLTYSMGLFSHEYNRAKLTNVLLNYSSEKGTELNPDTFKALVSGEPLQAREPYGKSFTLFNKVRFINNANELPRETEHTEAYFRRYLIIPFDVTITEEQRDIDLADKVIANELSGVFNWLLEGLNRIIAQKKFSSCEKSAQALNDFRRQSDSVALFLDEYNYKPSTDIKEPLADLYTRYKGFCQEDNYKPVGKNKFSVRIENKGYEKTRLNNGTTAFMMETPVSLYGAAI
jgi:putative DNA primase/helicase